MSLTLLRESVFMPHGVNRPAPNTQAYGAGTTFFKAETRQSGNIV